MVVELFTCYLVLLFLIENHFIYYGYWGVRPWDDCYFLVPESEADFFLTHMSKKDVYKQPVRAFVKNTWLSTKE